MSGIFGIQMAVQTSSQVTGLFSVCGVVTNTDGPVGSQRFYDARWWSFYTMQSPLHPVLSADI